MLKGWPYVSFPPSCSPVILKTDREILLSRGQESITEVFTITHFHTGAVRKKKGPAGTERCLWLQWKHISEHHKVPSFNYISRRRRLNCLHLSLSCASLHMQIPENGVVRSHFHNVNHGFALGFTWLISSCAPKKKAKKKSQNPTFGSFHGKDWPAEFPDYLHALRIYCCKHRYTRACTHTLRIDQCVVKESYDCELLYHDCFDENVLPRPWKPGTAVDMVLQTR